MLNRIQVKVEQIEAWNAIFHLCMVPTPFSPLLLDFFSVQRAYGHCKAPSLTPFTCTDSNLFAFLNYNSKFPWKELLHKFHRDKAICHMAMLWSIAGDEVNSNRITQVESSLFATAAFL